MRATFTGQALRLAVILALVGCLASAARAQGPAAESAARPAVKKASATIPAKKSSAGAETASGQQDGIKVHGHWVIEVRNPDGTLVKRHEFENGLVNFAVLPRILAHGGSFGQWVVQLIGVGANQPCDGIVSLLPCALFETAGPPTFGSLNASTTATEFVLQGAIRVRFAAQIVKVATLVNICDPSQPPSININCLNVVGISGDFTVKDVTSLNIQVTPDQVVDVTVRISFS